MLVLLLTPFGLIPLRLLELLLGATPVGPGFVARVLVCAGGPSHCEERHH